MESKKFYVHQVGAGVVEGACHCSPEKDETKIEIQTFNIMRCPHCCSPCEFVFTHEEDNEEFEAQLEMA